MPPRRVLVVAAGADPSAVAAAGADADLVICADGGVDVTEVAGVTAHRVVGDFDSATPAALDAAVGRGAVLERHPAAKDESDLELALGAACAAGASEIEAVLGAGGRLDHQLANLFVLASPRWAPTAIAATVGRDRVWVVRRRLRLPLPVGAAVALHAVGGPADDVRTSGLRYPLDGERLDPFEARGIANEVIDPAARVELADGVLLVVAPRPAQSDQAV